MSRASSPLMPETPCLVLPHVRLDGASNMAIDEAMLDHVAAGSADGPALFRTYEWSGPTLSLGYFQSIGEAESDPRWEGVAVVRRASGGGALLHDREVTFALVVPVGHPLARRSGPLYRALHEAVARTLLERGVPVGRRGEGPETAADRPRPFLCFQDHDPEDLVVGRWKVVGSAQRRRAGAVLQHGSVLLSASPLTPELPGASVLVEQPPGPETWAPALREGVPRALRFAAEGSEWPTALLARSEELVRETYGSPVWTRRR